MRRGFSSLVGAGAALIASVTGSARATWSILIVDTRTGEIAVGSATCLTRLDLLELTPVLIAGKGAVTAQAAGDSSGVNRVVMRDRLIQGVAVADILAELAGQDPGHQSRQYGMVDVTGGAVTFTGSQASDWAGGVTGQSGDLVWAVQGNILTGPNVVTDAVDAIVQTQGDLAEKLMAAMVASRVGGGDGRCSCAPNAPTACGSPPPGDFKSAHIGYMLVARIEDLDASRGYEFAPEFPSYFATPDIDGDGWPDMAAAQVNSGSVTVFANTTPDGSGLSTADIAGVADTGAGQIRRLGSGDVNGDGHDDLVFVAASPNEVGYLPGDGLGWFGDAVRTPLEAEPSRIAVGDIDNDGAAEIALTLTSTGAVRVYKDAAGVLAPVVDTTMANAPTGVAIAAMDADAYPDLVVATRDDDTITVLRHDGMFGLTTYATHTDPGLGPVDVAAGDIFGPFLGDVAAIGAGSRRLTVLRQTDPGVFAASSSTLASSGKQVAIGQATPDARGVFTLSGTNQGLQIHTERSDQPGTLQVIHTNRIAVAQESFTLADTNGDGLDDVVSGGFSRGLTLMDNLGDGSFPPFNGFANGGYFMSLNVADALDSTPDPVDLLLGQFADWRLTLEGRIDAVQTTLEAPSRVQAGSAYTLRVRTRDWRGDPIAPASLSVEAFPIEGGATVLDVRTPEPGVAEIDVLASAAPGDDRIGVRLDDGVNKPVRLMPDARVAALADLADFNDDGVRNFFDLRAFLRAFQEQDPAADLNGDGKLTFVDVSDFLTLFLAP